MVIEDEKFHVWWYRTMGVVVFGFGAICQAAWVDLFWPLALLAVPLLWIAIRSARVGVTFTASKVIVRGVFRTRSASWNSVVDVRDTSGSSTGLPWRVPEFVLQEGRIKAEEVRTLRKEGTIVDEVLRAGRHRIDRHG